MAAQPAPPRLRVACRQTLRHRAHQHAHPLQVAAFQVGKARGFQQFLAEFLRLPTGEQQQVAFDQIARLVAQSLDAILQPIGSDLLVVLAQCLHVALDLTQAHAIEDAAGVEVLLGKEPDVLDAGLARGRLHRCGERGAVVVQQHLGQRTSAPSAAAFATEAALHGGRARIGRRFIFLRKTVAPEVEVEAFVEQVLLVRRLRQHERQCVLQDGAIGVADHLHGARSIDAFRRGHADADAAGGLEELAKGFGGQARAPTPNALPQGEGEFRFRTPPPLAGGGQGEGAGVYTHPGSPASCRAF